MRTCQSSLVDNTEMGTTSKREKILKVVQRIDRIGVRRPAVLANSSDSSRLLGLDDGLIAFAPRNAQVGDLVCQFKWCDFFIILRKDDQTARSGIESDMQAFKIVGTAGLIWKPVESKRMSDLKSVKVDLHVDIHGHTSQVMLGVP